MATDKNNSSKASKIISDITKVAKKSKTKSSKSSKSGTSKTKSISLGNIIVIAVVIIALVLTLFVFRTQIGDVILSFSKPDEQSSHVLSRSVLSGKDSVSLPVEINKQDLGFEIHFIDVGQGDSIVLRFSDGVDIIIDAGSGTSASSTKINAYLAYLEQLNIDKFDYMIATHPDADHINILDDVLVSYDVDTIFFNDKGSSKTAEQFKERAVEENADLIIFDEDGDIYKIEGDDYLITIYAPGTDRFEDSVNDMSPIIVVECYQRRVLLTGDAEEAAEKWFVDQFDTDKFDCDIVKIGHHGSDSSSKQDFLEFISAEYAVISVAEYNGDYKHPNPFTMNRLFNMGIVTYRTNRHGTIVLYCDKEGNFAFGVQNEVPPENNKYGRDELMIITIIEEE